MSAPPVRAHQHRHPQRELEVRKWTVLQYDASRYQHSHYRDETGHECRHQYARASNFIQISRGRRHGISHNTESNAGTLPYITETISSQYSRTSVFDRYNLSIKP